MITLEKYDVKFVDDFVEFIKETQQYGDEFGDMKQLERIMGYYGISKKFDELTENDIKSFFPTYVDYMLKFEKVETKPIKDYVEADSYFICKDGKMIGELNFRKRMAPSLLISNGGHIGYKIKYYSERGKGYATEALKLALQKAWNEGYKEVIVTCRYKNLASTKVIEKCGGFLNRIVRLADGDLSKEYYIFAPMD